MIRKNSLKIIGLIALLAIVAGLYFYLRNFRIRQDLANFMPSNALIYAEYNLQDKDFIKFNENNFRGQVRFNKLLTEAGMFGNLSKDIISEADKIVAMIVLDENGEQHKAWIIQSPNVHKFRALLPKDSFETLLNSKTLALSPSRDVLNSIQAIDPLTEHTAQQNKILNKFSSNNFINIYLSGEYLKSLSESPDPSFALTLNNLELDTELPAFLGLQAQDNKIVYNFYASTLEKDEPESFKDTENLQILSLANGFLEFSTANIKYIYENLISNIPVEKQEELTQKYEFEWSDLESLLDAPGTIFINSPNGKVDAADILNLKKYNYALKIYTDLNEEELNEFIDKIKKSISLILAFQEPGLSTDKLPDGTPFTSLVAQPELFKFSAEDGIESVASENYSFSLALQESNLVFGNSKDLVRQILSAEVSPNIDCEYFSGSETILINGQKLIFGLLSFVDSAIINTQQNKKEVELTGCLLY